MSNFRPLCLEISDVPFHFHYIQAARDADARAYTARIHTLQHDLLRVTAEVEAAAAAVSDGARERHQLDRSRAAHAAETQARAQECHDLQVRTG